MAQAPSRARAETRRHPDHPSVPDTPTVSVSSALDGCGAALRAIRSQPGTTLTELAHRCGVVRSTMSARVERLVTAGLVTVTENPAKQRGRPAMTYRMNPDAGYALALHVGMSGFRAAVIRADGTPVDECFTPFDLRAGAPGFVSTAVSTLRDLLRNRNLTHAPLLGMGIGLPSIIELNNDRAAPEDPRWNSAELSDTFRSDLNLPVFVDHDVNLLGLAERQRGWPDTEIFVCLKLGTYLNTAVIVNGVPIRGVSGLAGEFGHIKVPGESDPCTCGSRGCLNTVAGARALVTSVRAHGTEVDGVRDVVRLALNGSPVAARTVREASHRIGVALGTLSNVLAPAVICIWGYLADAGPMVTAGIREGFLQSALPDIGERLQVEQAGYGDMAGVHGAAVLVLETLFTPEVVDAYLQEHTWQRAYESVHNRAS